MRRPISIQVPRFDVNTLQPQIDDVCNAFDQYLSSYPGRASASKHAVMGPVGKILNEVKSGRMDPTSLKGYALRVHEAAQQFPSMDAVVALESGIDRLITLLSREDIPLAARDAILDRIDYGVYYARRKRQIEQRERQNAAFREFLQQRYGSVQALAAAWDGGVEAWERVYAFGPKSPTYGRANAAKRKDMDDFREAWRQTAAEPIVDVDDEGVTA